MSLYLADRWIKRSEVQSQNNPSRLKLSQSRFVRQCQKRYARILIDGVLRQGDSNAIRGSPTSLMLTCANTLTASALPLAVVLQEALPLPPERVAEPTRGERWSTTGDERVAFGSF
jgi:hypothetical protein